MDTLHGSAGRTGRNARTRPAGPQHAVTIDDRRVTPWRMTSLAVMPWRCGASPCHTMGRDPRGEGAACPDDAFPIRHRSGPEIEASDQAIGSRSRDVGVAGAEGGRGQSVLSALGQLLPIAIAVAVSSVPITLTILILLSPRRNRVAIPFLIGWVVGMAVVVAISALGANALPIRSFRTTRRRRSASPRSSSGLVFSSSRCSPGDGRREDPQPDGAGGLTASTGWDPRRRLGWLSS